MMMSRLMKGVVPVATLMLAAFGAIGGDEDRSERRFAELIERWHEGGVWYSLAGQAISQALVTEEETFFEEMSRRPRLFEAWLEGLQRHTFTVFIGDEQARLDLKRQMLDVSKRYVEHPEFGNVAREIIKKLNAIDVIVLDRLAGRGGRYSE
jgi:hypothetical protein